MGRRRRGNEASGCRSTEKEKANGAAGDRNENRALSRV